MSGEQLGYVLEALAVRQVRHQRHPYARQRHLVRHEAYIHGGRRLTACAVVLVEDAELPAGAEGLDRRGNCLPRDDSGG